ncbi:hypothetical protein [Pseudarthrobacter sp. S9]|uniref:hypothetical protein n=1 Tax=Pseudarthrobacter sp. S9 TaxID=3418421 RepID=UPI003D06E449
MRKAFSTADTLSWRWHDQGRQPSSFTARYHALVPAGELSWARRRVTVAAALYPAVVDLTAAIASPVWAAIAHSSRPGEFLDRIRRQVTGGWMPQGSGDPLRH